MTIQIVLNAKYGGFGLSRKACEWLVYNKGRKEFESELATSSWNSYCSKIGRSDPDLIECIQTLGSKVASGECANLIIEEIYFDPWDKVTCHDGYESITG